MIRVYTTRDGLAGNDVRSVIATAEDRVLVGSSAGLDKLEHGQWSRVRRRSSEPLLESVVSLAQDIFGTVWLGLNYEGIDALLYVDPQGMAQPAPVRPHTPGSRLGWLQSRSDLDRPTRRVTRFALRTIGLEQRPRLRPTRNGQTTPRRGVP